MSDSDKCIGCNNPPKTKKGWCSGKCYLKNQAMVENSGRIKKGKVYTKEEKLQLSEWSKNWAKNNPHIVAENVKRMNTSDSNRKKGHSGSKHPKWIKDRSLVKNTRCIYEEKKFFKEVLEERGYKCEITGINKRNLSVHHLDSVHLFPHKKFDKNNVIVITKDIHMDFHKKYGFQWATKEKWDNYVKETFGEI
jgi:hypothetical protein